MSELFTLIVILLLVLFVYEMFRSARDARHEGSLAGSRPAFPGRRNPGAGDDIGDNPTVRLIGRDNYLKMTDRVDTILRVHSEDRFVAVRLSCGPESEEGKRTLHKLLPGDELKMVSSPVNGVNRVVFFFGGICIGAVMLVEAELLMEIVNAHRSTGIYVAEQNCYDLDGVVDLGIILFYNPSASVEKDRVRKYVDGASYNVLRPAEKPARGPSGLCEN